MLKHEFIKLYIKQHFFVILIFVILLKITSLGFTNGNSTNLSSQDEKVYNDLLIQIGGELNNEKETALNNQLDELYNAKKQATTLYNDLVSGEYTDSAQYSKEYEKLLPMLQKEKSLCEINNKFLFANKDREHRWILSQSLPIIETNSVDYILLIFILLVSILIYYPEENTNMLRVIKTNKSGCKSTSYSKILLLCLTVLFICIAFFIIELSWCIIKLKSGEIFAPIQSLSFFSNSNYNITILEGFLSIWAIKIIGYLFISFLCSVILFRFKNSVVALSFFLGLYVIEPFALNNKRILYYTPFSLVKATGFLRGNAFKIVNPGTKTEKTITDFTNINATHFIAITVITVIITVILIRVCYKYYYRWKDKRLKVSVLLLACIILCTSCASKTANKNPTINISHNNVLNQNEKSYFYNDGKIIKMVDKKSGEEIEIILDAFSSEIQDNTAFACTEKYFYYLVSAPLTNEIFRINLETFSQENIFSQNISDIDAFLGLTKRNISFGIYNIKDIFVVNDNLYLTDSEGVNLYCYNIQSKEMKTIISDGNYNVNISIIDEKIYYLNSMLQIKCYDIKTQENKLVSDQLFNALYIYEDTILVSNSTGIYTLNSTDGTTKKISDISSNNIAFDGENVFYKDKNYNLYLLNTQGEKQLLCSESVLDYDIIKDKNTIIYSYLVDGKKYQNTITY